MRHISSVLLIAVLLGCGNEPRVTQPLASHVGGSSPGQYDIVLLPTLGAAASGSRGR